MSARHVIHHKGSPREDGAGCLLLAGVAFLFLLGPTIGYIVGLTICLLIVGLISVPIIWITWYLFKYPIKKMWFMFFFRRKLTALRESERALKALQDRQSTFTQASYSSSYELATSNIKKAEAKCYKASTPLLALIRQRKNKLEIKRLKELSHAQNPIPTCVEEKVKGINQQLADIENLIDKIITRNI